MTFCSKRRLFHALAVVLTSALATLTTVNGQAPTASPKPAPRKPPPAAPKAPAVPPKAPAAPGQQQVMAEDVYTNIQVLKGISAAELWDTMGFISASTGFNCADC